MWSTALVILRQLVNHVGGWRRAVASIKIRVGGSKVEVLGHALLSTLGQAGYWSWVVHNTRIDGNWIRVVVMIILA